ncbi:shikimate kinase [Cellvibrio sp. QJXJ]|uniref:shikimate kinase n=1 Tax=Cellvibrio sp. QJXJ TaxID=2964606 RepID=UPI0021C2E5B1|nr:shikimate kinase [Cellvibrio sp. QJXJ]UUA74020.1 shikimate kinase [Cellvibrio sp. QJXJ]
MNPYHQSLILIGMPGAGKSTLGLLLAKNLAKDFVDTDLLIQLEHRKTLQDILHHHGYMALRNAEEKVLLNAHYPNHVIATGGSAVYSDVAMHHLKQFGPIVFLDVTVGELEKRIHNMENRGIARPAGQSFADVYSERRPLYLRYADIVIDCDGKNIEDLMDEIICQEANAFAAADA